MDGASTLAAFLDAIYTTEGKLTPELVRDAARPEDSPAHAWVFNVPETQAAETYYLQRAHELIRYVKVEMVPTDGGTPRRVRFYHAIPGDDDAYVYEPLTVIRQSPTKLDAARTEAMRRLRDAERAVDDLAVISASPAGQGSGKGGTAGAEARRGVTVRRVRMG